MRLTRDFKELKPKIKVQKPVGRPKKKVPAFLRAKQEAEEDFERHLVKVAKLEPDA